MMAAFPVLDEPLHIIIGATVTDFLKTIEQSMSSPASRPCQLRLFFQPLREFTFKLAKLWGDRLNPFIFGFFYHIEVFTYRWARKRCPCKTLQIPQAKIPDDYILDCKLLDAF